MIEYPNIPLPQPERVLWIDQAKNQAERDPERGGWWVCVPYQHADYNNEPNLIGDSNDAYVARQMRHANCYGGDVVIHKSGAVDVRVFASDKAQQYGITTHAAEAMGGISEDMDGDSILDDDDHTERERQVAVENITSSWKYYASKHDLEEGDRRFTADEFMNFYDQHQFAYEHADLKYFDSYPPVVLMLAEVKRAGMVEVLVKAAYGLTDVADRVVRETGFLVQAGELEATTMKVFAAQRDLEKANAAFDEASNKYDLFLNPPRHAPLTLPMRGEITPYTPPDPDKWGISVHQLGSSNIKAGVFDTQEQAIDAAVVEFFSLFEIDSTKTGPHDIPELGVTMAAMLYRDGVKGAQSFAESEQLETLIRDGRVQVEIAYVEGRKTWEIEVHKVRKGGK